MANMFEARATAAAGISSRQGGPAGVAVLAGSARVKQPAYGDRLDILNELGRMTLQV